MTRYYKAVCDGEVVRPHQVDSEDELFCPNCNEPLSFVRSHTRAGAFVSAHFSHQGERPDDCDAGGESPEHYQMKSIAYSKAQHQWPEAEVKWESGIGDKIADVLVEFPESHHKHGHGVAIEVQHRNHSKDIEETTQNHLDAGYSALWLEAAHYSGRDVDLDAGDWCILWAERVPSTEDWSGYHGIVHWLWQDKDAAVKREIPIPIEREKTARYWNLKFAWKRGWKSRLKADVSIFLPCGQCMSLVSHGAKMTHEKRVNSWMLNLFVSEAKCSTCGCRTKPTNTRLRLSTDGQFTGFDRPWTTREIDAKMILPCPRCQEHVKFDVIFESTGELTHPWADIVVQDRSKCDDCDLQVRLKSRNIRLRTRHFGDS